MRTYNLTLNRRNKTIQVRRPNHKIRLGITRRRINLKHSGLRGPQGVEGPMGPEGPTGPQGPTGVSTFVRVHHGSDPNVARPSALYVEWVGTVAPTNGTAEDTWIDTA